MLTRVAVATSQDVATVLRAPYRQTLWTYYHLQQQDRIDHLKLRGDHLSLAGLMMIAFHEPKKMKDEYNKLMSDLGQVPTAQSAIESAGWIVDAVEKIDKAEGKIP